MPRSLYFSLLFFILQVLGCGEGSAPGVGLGGHQTSGDGGSGVAGNAGSGGSAGAGGTTSTGGTGGVGGTGGSSGAGGTGGTGGGGTGGAGEGGSGGSISGPITSDLICDRLAEIQCASQDACCNDDSRKHASRDECFAAQKSICEDELTIEAVASDGEVQYDMASAAGSFDDFEERALECDTSVVSWATSQQGFRGLLSGTLDSGAQCGGNALDVWANRAAVFRCQGDMTCRPDGSSPSQLSSWSCKARSGEGGHCVIDLNCQDGLACDRPGDAMDVDGSCVSLLQNGGTCDRGTQCQSGVCLGEQCVEATVDNVYCLDND